jgi:hypothetical protein
MMLRKRKARVLTRLKISEVSAVDKGAGEGCQIKLMKRASNAAFAKATGRLAMSVKSILADPACDRDGMLAKTFAQFQDHLDELMGSYGKNLDVSVGRAAPNEGMPDSDDDADETEHLSDDADADDEKEKAMTAKLKSLDAIAICKQMVSEEHAFGLSEHDLVSLVDTYARANDSSFVKMFTAQDETGLALRKAVDIAKNAQFVSRTSTLSKQAEGMPGRATLTPRVTGGRAARAVDNPTTALEALQRLVDEQRKQFPALSESQAWQRVYEHPDNAALAARERAENRPTAAWT